MQYLDIMDSQRSGICLLENVYLFIIEFVKFN